MRLIAVLSFLAAAACGSSGGDAGKSGAANTVSVEAVREQVRQFNLGGGEKDAAGEKFFNWGAAAHPAMLELTRDPSLTEEELDGLMFIVATNAHTPELFDALRARISTIPDTEARSLRLGLLEEYRALPATP